MDIYYRYGEKEMSLWKYIYDMALSFEDLLFSFVLIFQENDEQEKKSLQPRRFQGTSSKKAFCKTKTI